MKIKIYIEGGGSSPLQDTQFRAAWATFFEKAGLRALRKMPATFRGSGRNQTFDAYCTAVKTRRPVELPLLLVDSEDVVPEGLSSWQHLKKRDGWDQPVGASEDDAFLMATCMETWLVADREALRNYFRNCWKNNALPEWPDLAKVERGRVFQALVQATAACGKKQYAKGSVSFDVLQHIDPAIVQQRCPFARDLIERLRGA